jgi:Zn-dependent peptidase ImmA (M78 family)
MTPVQAYAEARELAQTVRNDYGIEGPCVKISQLRAIYKDKGIKLTYWPHKLRKLRGAYISDDLGASVMVFKGLPDDPKAFTLAHELKHHLLDSEACSTVESGSASREIAAEVFAAELLFPEELFVQELATRGVSRGHREPLETVQLAIIQTKRDTGTTLSYLGMAKRAERLRYAESGYLVGTKWKKLEEAHFGVPFYRRRLTRSTTF